MIDQPRVGIGELAYASRGDLGLDKKRVVQCALSRDCGVCAQTLDRPVVFVGTEAELARNAFVFPPTHRACAEHALRTWARDWPASLGQRDPVERWVMVATSGFEFVRPTSEMLDRRATFEPNSRVEELSVPD